MVARLMEAHWFRNRDRPTPARIDFWLRECRTSSLLIEMVEHFPREAAFLVEERPALAAAADAAEGAVDQALAEEQSRIAALDKAYWLPLRKKLEAMRRKS